METEAVNYSAVPFGVEHDKVLACNCCGTKWFADSFKSLYLAWYLVIFTVSASSFHLPLASGIDLSSHWGNLTQDEVTESMERSPVCLYITLKCKWIFSGNKFDLEVNIFLFPGLWRSERLISWQNSSANSLFLNYPFIWMLPALISFAKNDIFSNPKICLLMWLS